MILSIVLLCIAIVAYSCSQSTQHGKFIIDTSFWNASSWKNKYKVTWLKAKDGKLPDLGQFTLAPDTWYYRFNKIKYKEKFPLSATILSFTTDGYHLCQFIFFLSLSLSFVLTLGFSWVKFGLVYGGVHLVHWAVYRFLSR